MLLNAGQEIATKVFTEKFLHLCAGAVLLTFFYYLFSDGIKNEIISLNRPDFTYSSLLILLLSFTFIAYAFGMISSIFYNKWMSGEDYRNYRNIICNLTDKELLIVYVLTYNLKGLNYLNISKDKMWSDYNNLLIYDLININPGNDEDKIRIDLKNFGFFCKANPKFSLKILTPRVEIARENEEARKSEL